MIKHFYSHIIETESITLEMEGLNLSDEEKNHLTELMESSIHYKVMDTVLSELSDDDKKAVLSHMHAKKHEDVWKLLYKKIDNIEDKIKKAAGSVKRELIRDIKEVKNG